MKDNYATKISHTIKSCTHLLCTTPQKSKIVCVRHHVDIGISPLYVVNNVLKTLFNIVEERLKKLLNFDVSAV